MFLQRGFLQNIVKKYSRNLSIKCSMILSERFSLFSFFGTATFFWKVLSFKREIHEKSLLMLLIPNPREILQKLLWRLPQMSLGGFLPNISSRFFFHKFFEFFFRGINQEFLRGFPQILSQWIFLKFRHPSEESS